MSFFRSEEHIARFLSEKKFSRGEVVPLEQVWRLAKAWYANPLDSAWRPRTMAENQAVLESVGLVSDFWKFNL